MPVNYTVIFTHPSGATATFIYEDGEMSALAKGLDAEQFWTFKQVKALLLRNEEMDLDLAKEMMAKSGFKAQVMRPLPDLLAATPARPRVAAGSLEEEPVLVHYRTLHSDEFLPFRRYGASHGEVHWRENEPRVTLPPHRAPALTPPAATSQPTQQEIKEWVSPHVATSHGEVHWREEH
jgi:hypothetical protein